MRGHSSKEIVFPCFPVHYTHSLMYNNFYNIDWPVRFCHSETYSCKLRLKSLAEDNAIMMQPGSGESHVLYVPMFPILPFTLSNLLGVAFPYCEVWRSIWNFNSFPDSHGDDLIVEILDPMGKDFGRVLVQLANISEDSVSHFYLPFLYVSTFQVILMKKPYRLRNFAGGLFFVSQNINMWENSSSILTIQQVLMITAIWRCVNYLSLIIFGTFGDLFFCFALYKWIGVSF